MLYKIGVLENFAKIYRKTPVLGSHFNKVFLLKRESSTGVLLRIIKSTTFTEHLQTTASVNRKKALNLISRDFTLS